MKRLPERIREILSKRRVRRFLTRVVSIVGVLVVFATTYALVLPAITMEKQAACGIEEHQHDDSCFELQLICGEEESETHQHTDECYERVLVCEKPVHTHSTECYETFEETYEEPADTDAGTEEDTMSGQTAGTDSSETENGTEENGTEAAAADGIRDTDSTGASDENTDRDETGSEKADAKDIDPSRSGSTEDSDDSDKEFTENHKSSSSKVQADAVNPEDGTIEGESLDAAEVAVTEDKTYAGLQTTLDLAGVLSDRTGLYYFPAKYDEDGIADTTAIRSDSVTDWEKVKDDTQIASADFVRVYLAYTIPAGTLNKDHYTARYRLPGALRLTENRVEAINKSKNGISKEMEASTEITRSSTDADFEEDFPTDEETWLGAEAIEGTRTPDRILDKSETEYISATVKVENIYKSGEYRGQDLIFTFTPYTVRKNQTTYNADGTTLAEGEKVRGFFTLDFNPDQISCDESGTAEILFAKESDVNDVASGQFAQKEIRRVLHLKDSQNSISGNGAIGEDATDTAAEAVNTDNTEQDRTEKKQTGKGNQTEENKDGTDAVTADQKDGLAAAEEKFLTGSVIAASGEAYEINVTYGEDAQIPDGSELRVREILESDSEYKDYSEQAVEKVEEVAAQIAEENADAGDNAAAKADSSTGNADGNNPDGQALPRKSNGYVRVFDIEIWYNGQKIEPEEEVLVEIRLLDAPENKEISLDVVHFAEDGPEVLSTDQNTNTRDTADTSIQFTTDAFSVYTIVGTETITVPFVASDGSTYEVTVTYGLEAGIPKGSQLKVAEVTRNDQKYDDYVEQAANKIRSEIKDLSYIKLLDISIIDANGDDVALEAAVDVQIRLLDNETEEATHVIHFEGEEETPVNIKSSVSGDIVTFSTNGFSVYAVVGEGDTGDYARMTVNFYNGENLIDTMYVKNKDELNDLEIILYDPGTGELAGREMFRGWTFNPNYTSADANSHYDPVTDPDGLMTIEDIRKWAEAKQITENEEVNIYAMIFTHFTVSYVDLPEYGTEDGDISLGTGSLYLARTETQGEYTVSMPYTPHDAFHNFEGWRVVEGAENIVSATYTDDEEQTIDVDITEPIQNGTKLVIKGDITLRVNAPRGNWLVFDENAKGGTYNAPQFLEPDEEAVMPDPDGMLLTGYDFAGWFYNKEGTGDEFTGGTINERTTVYAKWTPKTIAPYKYLIYQQTVDSIGKESLTEDDYTLVESVAVDNGTVGTAIPYTFHNNGDEDYVTVQGTDYHYTGFSFQQPTQEVEITADGKATLKLYFDRIKYNLRFYYYRERTTGFPARTEYSYGNNSAAGQNTWGIVSWHTSNNDHPTQTYGDDHTATIDNYTGHYFVLSAYYGEDISDQWPTYEQITGVGNNAPVSFVMMNGTKLKPNPIATGAGTVKGIVQTMDENILGLTNNVDGNFLIVRFNTYNNWTYHVYYETIPGEEYDETVTCAYNGKTYYWDHDDTSRSSNTQPWSQNASNYEGFTPVVWTDTDTTGNDQHEAGKAYFDGIAPTSQIPIGSGGQYTGYSPYLNYYYDRLAYKVNYHDGVYVDQDGNQLESGEGAYLTDSEVAFGEEYAYGATIPENARNYDPTSLLDTAHQNEFVFEGWYFDQACSIPYEWGNMPIDGIKVYAKWRQKQYRVFLHPNVPNEDKEIDWGSDNQQMNFRRSYGLTVSLPEGLQEGYEMVGWFKDPECTEVFDESTKMTDGTTSSDYVKTRDWTDPMDEYGNIGSNPTNSDANRFWITRKLDLYAKWRQVLVGAIGINVVYDAGDGDGAPTDSTFYLDNAEAVAQGAPETFPEGKVFRYWVLQRWDDSANNGEGGFVDVEPMTEAVPGDTFTVLLANAHQEEAAGHTPENPQYTYTVQLRAEYVDADELTPTHIDWYNNYVSDPQPPEHSHTGQDGKGLKINEAVEIYTPLARDGYQFVGWARVPINISNSRVEENQTVADLLDQDTIESYMYLYYIDDEYYLDEEKTTKVTQVAADEETPYHDMYAIWKKLPSLIVKKTDDKGNALDNAYFKFTLFGDGDLPPSSGYVEEDATPVRDSSGGYKMASGSTGMTYSNLSDGTYIVTETTPPDGYIMTNTATSVYLYEGVFYEDEEHTKPFADTAYDNDGNLIISVTNTPGQALPNTGGPGTLLYTLSGIALMLGAALMYGFRLRRRERRFN